MSHFEQEIAEQPDVLASLLAGGRSDAERIAKELHQFGPTSVVVAARGSSDNAARYAQYLLGAHNRLTVSLAAPSLFTLYGTPPSMKGMCVVGISQSGQSPDIVAVLEEGRRQGAFTLALTNNARSPLAVAAHHHLDLRAGEERAVAATKTYTAELFALAMLSAAIEGDAARWTALAALPDQARAALSLAAPGCQRAERFRYAEYFVTLGRGFNYCTAFEVALKVKETSYVIAEPYSAADFLHGPIAMLEHGFPVFWVAPRSKVTAQSAQMLSLLEQRGAEVIALSDDAALLERAKVGLPFPSGIPEWLSPIAAVMPGQLWAQALCRARGLDPDRPRGLNKVTETR